MTDAFDRLKSAPVVASHASGPLPTALWASSGFALAISAISLLAGLVTFINTSHNQATAFTLVVSGISMYAARVAIRSRYM